MLLRLNLLLPLLLTLLCHFVAAESLAPDVILIGRYDGSWSQNPSETSRVFSASGGSLQVRAILNATSRAVRVELTVVQGPHMAPGRVHDITLVGENTDSNSSRTFHAVGTGFRGFWEREDPDSPKSRLRVVINKRHLNASKARFEQVEKWTTSSSNNNATTLTMGEALLPSSVGVSFRHVLDPQLWTVQEEETYARCEWFLQLHLLLEPEVEDSAISAFKRFLLSLSRYFQVSADHQFLGKISAREAQALRGTLRGICNKTSSTTTASTKNSLVLITANLSANRARFHSRVLSSHFTGCLIIIASFFQGFAVFAQDTVARHSERAQRGLSFAMMLWISSFDVLQIGVIQVLADIMPFSNRFTFISLLIRCLTWHFCGAPLMLRLRRTQLAHPDIADKRWLLGTFSVWRYFGLLLTFIVALFLLSDNMLTWPCLLVFSCIFLPQIYQNFVEDDATQPLPTFAYFSALSMCMPVVFATLLHELTPQVLGCAVFVTSIMLQAVILHGQVAIGPRFFVPRMVLNFFGWQRYDYAVQFETESDLKVAAKVSSLRHLTCCICQRAMRLASRSSSSNNHTNGDSSVVIGRTPCNHFFHMQCLKEWLRQRRVCPLCQAVLPAA